MVECAVLYGALAIVAALALVADWPRFRGPNGAGVSDEAALPRDLSAPGVLAWRTALPPGHSSSIVTTDRVFVTAAEGDELLTIALHRTTGAVAWQRSVPRTRKLHVDSRNHPAAATPATDGRNVFVFFQDVGLLSYDARGRERWRLPLGPFTNTYGMGSSPIVVDGLVILVCDQSAGSFMVAVDANSGRVRWRVDRPEATSGHSTPVIYTPPRGGAQVLVPGSFYLIAYDVADGRKVWWVSGLAFEMKATPVHDGTFVYISGTSASSFEDSYGRRIPAFAEVRDADANGDGRFARDELPDQLAKKWFRLLDLDGDSAIDGREWERYRLARQSAGGLSAFTLNGTGDVTSTNAAWHYDKAVPQLPSPLLYRGHILIVSDTGIATALDARTGAVLVQRRLQSVADNYFASPVAGDGKIFFAAESGKVSVAAADGALTALSEIDLAESIHATPAIAGGQLFVRTASALYCFGRKR